jgi:Oligosaccharyl transferase STT3 subunit
VALSVSVSTLPVHVTSSTKMADSSASRADIRSALSNRGGWKSLIAFSVLALAWLVGFSSRLFAVIRFESIIHEFDPWYVYFLIIAGTHL